MIEDENIQAIVENIRQDMTANIYQSLVDRGLQLWNAGNKTEAMDYFQASLTIRPDNPEALFMWGVCTRMPATRTMPIPCLTKWSMNSRIPNMWTGQRMPGVINLNGFSGKILQKIRNMSFVVSFFVFYRH